MMKRGADKQLNYENWDEPEEKLNSGTFEKADEATLKSRKLIVARRKSVQPTKPTMGLFKSFDAFGTNNNKSVGVPIFNVQKNEKYDDGDLEKLATLNKEVSAWISKHVSDDPYCILTPIFTDYTSHLSSLKSLKSGDFENKIVSSIFDQPSTTISSLFNSTSSYLGTSVNKFTTPSSLSTNSSSTSAANDGFSFHTKSVNSKTLESLATSKPSFLNNHPLTTVIVSDAAPSPALFSFTSVLKSAEISNIAASTSSEQVEDEEYVPPKAEVKEITENGSVYKVRCKLFYKKSEEWKQRGLGNLHIIPSDDNKLQLLIRADNNLGTILLNIIVSKELPMQLQKNNLTFACIPSPELPGDRVDSAEAPRLIPFLVRVKTEETAKELLSELDKYRGK